MGDFCLSVLEGLRAPLVSFGDPSKRVYFGYLLGALALAAFVWFVSLRGRCSLVDFLLPKSIWLHRSARLDYRLVFVRAVLDATLLAPFVVSVFATSIAVARFLWNHVAILPTMPLTRAQIAPLFTITAFLAQDFARYAVHGLSHRIPALWELHKVHHSAEVLTPFTVYRTHPLESLLMRGGAALATGVVAGVFVWMFPGKVSGLAILGVDALAVVWNFLGTNLRHSHVWLSFGGALERVFISPAQHQVHHSQEASHHHRNFGATFAIWDWMGGTLHVTNGRVALRFGLPAESRNHDDSVASVLVAPLGAALRRLAAPLRALAPVRAAPPPD